jgi:hypothetical protein
LCGGCSNNVPTTHTGVCYRWHSMFSVVQVRSCIFFLYFITNTLQPTTATTVYVEQFFSFGRDFVSFRRHRLSALSVTRGMTVAFYSKTGKITRGLLNQWKERKKNKMKKKEKQKGKEKSGR